jgi:hypothetical protein
MRSRVGWSDCCTRRKIGGLNLVDPKDVLMAALCKWLLMAFKPGESNLKVFLSIACANHVPPNTKNGC